MEENTENVIPEEDKGGDQEFEDAFDLAAADAPKEENKEIEEKTESEEPPQEEKTPEPEKKEEPPRSDISWEEKEKEYQGKIDALKNDYEEKLKEKLKPAPQDSDPYASLTEDEKKALEEYNAEFSEVSKYEDLKRKAEIKAIIGDLRKEFNEELAKVTGSLSPVTKFASDYGIEKHLTMIKDKHKDFDELVSTGKVMDWVKTQPAEVKNVYTKWYEEGTTNQVITLFDQYKANNKSPDPSLPDVKEQKKELKKQNMTVVVNKTGPVNSATVPKDDYDTAFDEAVRNG